MPESKDLFDESTMTFGEHLEVLRVHLIKSLFGLVICVVFWLYFGHYAIDAIRRPLDVALRKFGQDASKSEGTDYASAFWGIFGNGDDEGEDEPELPGGQGKDTDDEVIPDPQLEPGDVPSATIEVLVPVKDIGTALHELDGDTFKKPAKNEERKITLRLESEAFAQFEERLVAASSPRPVTLQVQEAFMTYVKVAVVTGLMTASPWIFFQVWLFVAAGLYPHERKYVYTYLPMSMGLFFAGALLCYFFVLPLVLDFLFGFNRWLQVEPNIQLTKWINFAIVLPLMFGLSFQLPLVMLFLERISIFQAQTYQEQRRMAILVIAILSMLLTPADPASMLMMMFPLIFLYEFGILLCKMSPAKTPFEGAEPV